MSGAFDESLGALARRFPDEASCLQWLFDVRYGQGTRCGLCGKPARWKPYGAPRQFVSSCCYHEISPCAETLFHKSRLSLQTWFYAMMLVSNFNGRLSQHFLVRHLGIGMTTAFRVADKVRMHMAALALRDASPFEGLVCVDEMQLSAVRTPTFHRDRPVVIFGIATRERFRFFCVANRRAETLVPIILRHVRPGARIVADGLKSYDCLGRHGYSLSRVNHARGLWRNDEGLTTTPIELCWARLRHHLEHVHQSVETRNVWKYLGQHMFIRQTRLGGRSPLWESLAAFPDIRRLEPKLREQIDLRRGLSDPNCVEAG